MSDTYTAHLIGSDEGDTVELEFIDGLPQKSFVRESAGEEDGDTEETVWELIDQGGSSEGPFRYQSAGSPGADYS